MSATTTAAAAERVPARATDTVLVEHAARGARLQRRLRIALAVFIWTTLLVVPPERNATWCYAVAAAYSVLAVALTWWLRPAGLRRRARWQGLPLVLDLLALGSVTALAGSSARYSWTAYIMIDGFFLLPVLAATQLRPRLSLLLAVPTFAVYVLTSMATRVDDGEPWSSLLLRSVVLLAVSYGAVSLSRIQRSRVGTIMDLATTRAELLKELTGLEKRERQHLSEALHDGALQFVLAARMELDDARDSGDPAAFDRVDQALSQSASLLRSTVSELHPAVLERAGLTRAVEDLLTGPRRRGLRTSFSATGPAPGVVTDMDGLAFSAARELLSNVVRHAEAQAVGVELGYTDGRITLTVWDDGTGADPAVLQRRLADGHIGLASHRLRVEAAGGTMTMTARRPSGSRVDIVLPAAVVTATPAEAVVVG